LSPALDSSSHPRWDGNVQRTDAESTWLIRSEAYVERDEEIARRRGVVLPHAVTECTAGFGGDNSWSVAVATTAITHLLLEREQLDLAQSLDATLRLH
jgi:hypothetical protein